MRLDSHDERIEAPVLLRRVTVVFDALADSSGELTVAEIAAAARIPTSTTYRLVGQLAALGMVSPGSAEGRYRLGLRLIGWGNGARASLSVRREALSVMTSLCEHLAETVQIAVREGLEGVFVESVESPHVLRQHTSPGQRLPLHAGASMRVLLAFAPEDVRRAYATKDRLVSCGPRTITDPDALAAELEAIRATGHAVSVGELYEGSIALSAPVRDASGEVVASLTVSGPVARWSEAAARTSAPAVIAAAEDVSRRLGYAGRRPGLRGPA